MTTKVQAGTQPVRQYATTDQPGPIQTVGRDFLYQLDDSPTRGNKGNLWSGALSPNNGYDPAYAHRAVQLFKTAPRLLRVLQELMDPVVESDSVAWHAAKRDAYAAIAEATKPLE